MMELTVAGLAATEQLAARVGRALFARRTVIYVASSREIEMPASGVLVIRCMGAGGGGAAAAYLYTQRPADQFGATGGSAGTVGTRTVRVAKGDRFTLVLGAGGAGVSGTNANGNAGGQTTVTGPGVAITIPGAPGGVHGATGMNPACEPPVGLDWYATSARNVIQNGKGTGGAAAAVLVGTPSQAASGQGGAGVGNGGTAGGGNGGTAGAVAGQTLMGELLTKPKLTRAPDASHCWLLVMADGGDYSGGTSEKGYGDRVQGCGNGGYHNGNNNGYAGPGGFGAGGGSSSHKAAAAGDGGRGGGGGAHCYEQSQGNNAITGKGGDAWVTLELLEDAA